MLIKLLILGKGRRFFLDGMRSGLELAGTETLPLGVTALIYKAGKA